MTLNLAPHFSHYGLLFHTFYTMAPQFPHLSHYGTSLSIDYGTSLSTPWHLLSIPFTLWHLTFHTLHTIAPHFPYLSCYGTSLSMPFMLWHHIFHTMASHFSIMSYSDNMSFSITQPDYYEFQ